MAKDGTRSQAETRFQKTQRTDDEARSTIDAEREAVRKKSAGLKVQRLAREAAEGRTDLDKKPAPKKRTKAKDQ